MDEAQSDEACATPENFVEDKARISWFERWQMAQENKLRAEPKVSRSVEDVWNNRGNKNSTPLPPRPSAPPSMPPPLPNKMP